VIKVMAFDIEILNAIPNRDGRREPGINYAQGWTDYIGQGIAVIGVWDYVHNMPVVICDDNLEGMHHYAETYDLFVSYNGINFDNKVLAAHGIRFGSQAQHYDILRELWIADGFDPDRPDFRSPGGYKLDDCAMANFGIGKSGDGAMAPIDWQRGKIGQVISYCLRDIGLTVRLFDRIVETGEMKHPKTGKAIKLRHPFGRKFAQEIPEIPF
jgi:RNase H-like protein